MSEDTNVFQNQIYDFQTVLVLSNLPVAFNTVVPEKKKAQRKG